MLTLLKQARHEVELLTLPGGDPWPKGLVNKIFFTAPVPFVKTLPFYGRGFRRLWAGLAISLAALRLAFRENYDAIHCSDRAIRTGGFLSWLFRKPFIFEWHATHSGHDLVKWLSRRSRRFRRSIDMIFSDFPYPFSRLRQIGVYGRIATLQLLPAENITAQPLPAIRHNAHSFHFRVVAIATSPDLQDLTPLCECLPYFFEHTPLQLTIIGSTPRANERFRHRLNARIGEASSHVAILPAPAQSLDLIHATEEADLVYLSAVPGPLPPAHLVDLMAARKALLAVQCPAFNTLLNTSNAMLVPYAAPAIAQALLQHLQMPTLCADHAQAAYTTIHAENNAKAVVEEVRRCYELALEGGITQ
jgi:hypothetical protein